jgi:glycerol kinase
VTHVLAIDEGTTGTHCFVLDAEGRIRGAAYREITQHYPHPGWVEHDPLEILDRTVAAARAAIAAAGERPVTIGIANQRETAVVWERDRPRAAPHAIVWQDRRTADVCAALAPHAEMVARTTGLTLDPYFSAAKFAWLLQMYGWTERARRGEVLLGTIDTWLIWNLTGGRTYATDPTNASRTSLYDIERRAWSAPLCALFGVPIEALPSVRSSTGDFGETDPEILGAAIPITGVAGDQQAALVGQGCIRPGDAKNTYGTGAFLLWHTGDRRPEAGDGLLTTIACADDGRPCYALEASIFVAGAAVQWLRDGLGLIHDAGETEAVARSVPSTDGVYFVPALTGLGAPHWEPRARGTIVGLTRGTTRAHLVRASLEAMAYGTADVLAAMRRRGGAELEALRVDGGAARNDWLMQFQADVLGVPVERPAVTETTALGAAALAGFAAGVWPALDILPERGTHTRFTPASGQAAAAAGWREWGRAVDAALVWARATPRIFTPGNNSHSR